MYFTATFPYVSWISKRVSFEATGGDFNDVLPGMLYINPIDKPKKGLSVISYSWATSLPHT